MIQDVDYTLKISHQPAFKEFSLQRKGTVLFSVGWMGGCLGLGAGVRWACDSECMVGLLPVLQSVSQHSNHHLDKVALVAFWLLWLCLVLFLFYLKGSCTVLQESLLIMKDTGIQLSTKTLFGKKTSRFLPIGHYRDMVIHEKLTPYDVYFYLALLMNADQKVEVPFRCFQPQLKTLLVIYHESKKLLDSRKKP